MDPPDFDPVIHAPARLKLMMLLAAVPSASFHELQRDAALTAGNLQAHLKALESAGYVEATRSFIERKPRMRYRLSVEGSRALRAYCDVLSATVRRVQHLMGAGARPHEEE